MPPLEQSQSVRWDASPLVADLEFDTQWSIVSIVSIVSTA
jgi:hypothetical protein